MIEVEFIIELLVCVIICASFILPPCFLYIIAYFQDLMNKKNEEVKRIGKDPETTYKFLDDGTIIIEDEFGKAYILPR